MIWKKKMYLMIESRTLMTNVEQMTKNYELVLYLECFMYDWVSKSYLDCYNFVTKTLSIFREALRPCSIARDCSLVRMQLHPASLWLKKSKIWWRALDDIWYVHIESWSECDKNATSWLPNLIHGWLPSVAFSESYERVKRFNSLHCSSIASIQKRLKIFIL